MSLHILSHKIESGTWVKIKFRLNLPGLYEVIPEYCAYAANSGDTWYIMEEYPDGVGHNSSPYLVPAGGQIIDYYFKHPWADGASGFAKDYIPSLAIRMSVLDVYCTNAPNGAPPILGPSGDIPPTGEPVVPVLPNPNPNPKPNPPPLPPPNPGPDPVPGPVPAPPPADGIVPVPAPDPDPEDQTPGTPTPGDDGGDVPTPEPVAPPVPPGVITPEPDTTRGEETPDPRPPENDGPDIGVTTPPTSGSDGTVPSGDTNDGVAGVSPGSAPSDPSIVAPVNPPIGSVTPIGSGGTTAPTPGDAFRDPAIPTGAVSNFDGILVPTITSDGVEIGHIQPGGTFGFMPHESGTGPHSLLPAFDMGIQGLPLEAVPITPVDTSVTLTADINAAPNTIYFEDDYVVIAFIVTNTGGSSITKELAIEIVLPNGLTARVGETGRVTLEIGETAQISQIFPGHSFIDPDSYIIRGVVMDYGVPDMGAYTTLIVGRRSDGPIS